MSISRLLEWQLKTKVLKGTVQMIQLWSGWFLHEWHIQCGCACTLKMSYLCRCGNQLLSLRETANVSTILRTKISDCADVFTSSPAGKPQSRRGERLFASRSTKKKVLHASTGSQTGCKAI